MSDQLGLDDELLARVRDLNPRTQVEWNFALAHPSRNMADGFDLEGHLKAVAAEVERGRAAHARRIA